MTPQCVTVGEIYNSHEAWCEKSRFIVTAVGLNHILIADHPLIKFNETYLEYCVTRKEFERKFESTGETK